MISTAALAVAGASQLVSVVRGDGSSWAIGALVAFSVAVVLGVAQLAHPRTPSER